MGCGSVISRLDFSVCYAPCTCSFRVIRIGRYLFEWLILRKVLSEPVYIWVPVVVFMGYV